MEKKKFFIIIPAVLLFLVIIIWGISAIFKGGGKKGPAATSGEINLTYWKLFDDYELLKPQIEEYEKNNKKVKINYVKKDYENYEIDLLNALAEGRGPDIFEIKNDWFPKHYLKLAPLPSSILTKEEYEKTFLAIALKDTTVEDKIYGIPFTIDTLALYSNPRIGGSPKKTWQELTEVVRKKTKRKGSYISQSGLAIGTAYNVESAFDILSLLMLQYKTPMVSDDRTKAYFSGSINTEEGKVIFPGVRALDFYTSFSNPKSSNYSWNNGMPDSLEAFISGKTAFVIDYSYQAPIIKKRSPYLYFVVGVMPQVKYGDEVYYASYWTEVVSKDCKNQEEAWKFLKFLSEKDNLKNYYKTKGKYIPSSRIDINQEQIRLADGITNIFAQQAQKAQSWYKGDREEVEKIFLSMIDSVVKKSQSSKDALDWAARQVEEVLKKVKE